MDRLTHVSHHFTDARETRRIHRDTWSGAVLIAVAAAYGVAALRIPAGDGEPGPGFLPVALALLLGVVSLVILWRGATSAADESEPSRGYEDVVDGAAEAEAEAEEEEEEEEKEEEETSARARSWLAALATVAYAALFQPLGFAVSTLAYAAALTRVFTRDRRMLFAVPIGVTLALFAFFRLALGVRLPPWPFG